MIKEELKDETNMNDYEFIYDRNNRILFKVILFDIDEDKAAEYIKIFYENKKQYEDKVGKK